MGEGPRRKRTAPKFLGRHGAASRRWRPAARHGDCCWRCRQGRIVSGLNGKTGRRPPTDPSPGTGKASFSFSVLVVVAFVANLLRPSCSLLVVLVVVFYLALFRPRCLLSPQLLLPLRPPPLRLSSVVLFFFQSFSSFSSSYSSYSSSSFSSPRTAQKARQKLY